MVRGWALWPQREMEEVSDAFVVRRRGLAMMMRVRGAYVEVEVDDPPPPGVEDEMREVARAYAESLSDNGVLRQIRAQAELAALPPFAWGSQVVGGRLGAERARERRDYIARAVRAARDAVLLGVPGEEAVRRAYDYLEDARLNQRLVVGRGEFDEGVLVDVYKAVETIQHAMGGQSQMVAALNVGGEANFVKRLANDGRRDARHPPRPGQAVVPPTPADVARAMDCAATIVHAYARRA